MAGKYTDTHPQFTVFVNGSFAPAADGEVEFFTVGNTGIGNRKDTYSDPALTIPNPNPVPLDGFGRSINPIFLLGSYNTVIRDSEGNQLDEVDNVSGPTDAEGVPSQVVDLAADLKPIDTTDFQSVYVLGTTVIGDGGQGHFYFSSTSTESDNGVDIIEPDVGGGRWLLQNNAHNSIYSQDASGTTDVFTIAPTPGVIDLDGSRVYFVRSLGANTLSSPTFQVGTSAAKSLRRHDVAVMQIGDTGPSGYEMILKLRTNESAYTLLNPYINIDGQFLVNSINADKLVTSSITTTQMGTNSVDTSELVNGAVTDIKIEANAVTTSKILNDNVTYAKIQNIVTGNRVLGRASVGEVQEVQVNNNMIASGETLVRSKMQHMADSTIMGRAAGAGTGDPTPLSDTQVNTILGLPGSFGALAALNTVSQSEIDSDSVGQSEIKEDSVALSSFSVNPGLGRIAFHNKVNTGGAYTLGVSTVLTSGGNDAWFCLGGSQGSYTSAYYIALAGFYNSAGASSGSANVTFIDASPPYNLNSEGDTYLFAFILENANGSIGGVSISRTPPWAYNGPTSVKATRMETLEAQFEDESDMQFAIRMGSVSHSSRLKKYNMQPTSIILPPWRGGDMDRWLEGPTYEEVEITHDIKNADMDLIPHPFVERTEGDKVIMLEPCSELCYKISELKDRGEDVGKLITEGYIDYSESSNAYSPKGVEVRKAKWK
jgi:hypothetical protein